MNPKISRTVAGGFLATLAMTVILYKLAPMMGMPKMDLAGSLGSMLGLGWTAGLLAHFMMGAIVFPLIYALGLYRLLPGAPVLRGVQWGAALWLLSQIMVMPMMGAGFFSAHAGGMIMAAGSLVNHAVYGTLLGSVAGSGAAAPASPQLPTARTA